MAKKKSIHTHVPTDLGVAILSIVVLLGVMFLLVAFNTPQNTTNTQTHASTMRPKPTPAPRKCKHYNKYGVCVRY